MVTGHLSPKDLEQLHFLAQGWVCDTFDVGPHAKLIRLGLVKMIDKKAKIKDRPTTSVGGASYDLVVTDAGLKTLLKTGKKPEHLMLQYPNLVDMFGLKRRSDFESDEDYIGHLIRHPELKSIWDVPWKTIDLPSRQGVIIFRSEKRAREFFPVRYDERMSKAWLQSHKGSWR